MQYARSVIIAAIVLWHAAAAFAATSVIDRIVAVVNDDIITLSQFETFKTLIFLGSPDVPEGRQKNRELLQQLVVKKLLQQEAAKTGIAIKPKEVDRAIESVLERNNLSLAEMERELEKQGASLQDYRSLMKAELAQSEIIARKVQSKVVITEEDMKKYYRENIRPDEKPVPRVRIQQILLAVPQDASAAGKKEIRRRAEQIRQNIIKGEAFATMAATYSDGPAARAGGDLGYFHRNELMPAIEHAAFSMNAGDVSGLIQTQAGFHIIKVLDKDTKEEDRTWQDRADEIRASLYNRQFQNIYDQWLTELQERAHIKINF